MLTGGNNGVNAPRAVMWTIGQIAEREGVSKPAVSRRVKRFADQLNLTVERDDQGRVAYVNVAEYDALRGRYDDPSKAQAPRRGSEPETPASESYDEALRQKTWHEVERRRIDLDQIRGKLVDAQSVAEGYDRASAVISDVIGRFDEHADDLAAVVAKDGVRGLHAALKRVGVELLAAIAAALHAEARNLRAGIVEDAPQTSQ